VEAARQELLKALGSAVALLRVRASALRLRGFDRLPEPLLGGAERRIQQCCEQESRRAVNQ
jgi:hypothetical protein